MADDPHPVVEAPVLVVAPVGVKSSATANVEPVAGRATVAPDTVVASPITTQEEDRVTYGQRKINLIWEVTQASIAILVTAVTLFVSAVLVLRGDGGAAAFLLLSNVFFMVSSVYLTRTNHQKTGGVGPHDAGR